MHAALSHCKSLSSATRLMGLVLIVFTIFTLSACVTPPPKPEPSAMPAPASSPSTEVLATKSPTPPPHPHWKPVALNDLPQWDKDSPLQAWSAMQRSCTRLAQRPVWQTFCQAVQYTPSSDEEAKQILNKHLLAYAQTDEAGNDTGIATAYFEPIYTGNLTRNGNYQWPLYAAPEPMLSLSREQLTPANAPVHPKLRGNELVWLDNPIDPFLAQVQGSVRIRLADGSIKRLGFAAKNGQAYVSIANTLIRQGAFTAAQASMERIKAWTVGKDASTVQALLNTNPSFVFFKWLDLSAELGPIGAYNIPLTPMRSVAVDTAFTPLGVPLWLETTTANGTFKQLMLAQDVGSAIKGAARVDIYMGTGEAAGRLASQQKNPSKVWVLWPK